MGIGLFAPETEVSDAAPAVSEALRRVGVEIEAGRLDEALRWADRADRLVRDSPIIHEILGRLFIRLNDAERAIKRLKLAAKARPTPGLYAVIVDALFSLRRDREAYRWLETGLGRFAVTEGDELALCARKHTLAEHALAPGWVGIGPDLMVYGEIKPDPEPRVHLLSRHFRSLPAVLTPLTGPSKGWSFSVRVPNGHHGALEASTSRGALVGSDAFFPPDFAVDGRAFIEGRTLKGWVRIGWMPDRTVALALLRDGEVVHRFASDGSRAPGGRRSIALDLEASAISPGRLDVAVELPGGGLDLLVDSPALDALPAPPSGEGARPDSTLDLAKGLTTKVDVVVPVFNSREETLACLASVKRHAQGVSNIIVVDDASSDPELIETLARMAEAEHITLLRNDINLGFPASVNRGFEVNPNHDVVVLNSDAEVHAEWLARLKRAAYGKFDVGTVTPLTNSGAIASYPRGGASSCSATTGQKIAALTGEVNAGVVVEAPTGVGFCLYVRRDCLSAVGPLDAALFGRGYGEENDFCMRASGLGWRHLLATDVYVRHQDGQSFGNARIALMERNSRLLSKRHPQYNALVEDFLTRDPAHQARRQIDEHRLCATENPIALLIGFSGLGGVSQFIEERAAILKTSGLSPLILQPAEQGRQVELLAANATLHDLQYDVDEGLAPLVELLTALPIVRVELHHFLDLPVDIVDRLTLTATDLSVYVHDYSWICPRITLLGGDGRYCGEPDLKTCTSCVKSHGARIEATTASALRQRSAVWLKRAHRIIAPTGDVERRLKRYFPQLKIDVEPWEEDQFGSSRTFDADRSGPVRVLVLGALGEQKGFSILKACAEDALARDLPLAFRLIGYTKDDSAYDALTNVFITGGYRNRELAGLIEREQPDIAFFPSATPETWCYALTHALRARLPIAAFDFGAIAERTRAANVSARLFSDRADAREINNHLLTLGGLTPPQETSRPPAAPPGPVLAPGPQVAFTVESKEALEDSVGGGGVAAMADSNAGLKASVQLLSLKMGVYQFSVRSGPQTRPNAENTVAFPAVQISLAPGVAHDSVEFMTGLRTEGAWLYDPKDLLIAKVKRDDTPVLITSYSRDRMAPLSIEVERVDGERPAQARVSRRPSSPSALVRSEGPFDRRADDGRRVLPLKILTHVSRRGDLAYVNQAWAGEIEHNLAIEGFALEPLADLNPNDIEYKALTEKGVETPWVTAGKLCGTRQMNLALAGFSVRARGERARQFDCRYRGRFQSGAIVGPATNGAPLRGATLDDHLVGIELYILESPPASPNEPAANKAVELAAPERGKRPVGPRFSVFRGDAS